MPIFDSHSLEFISRSVEQTRRVGMRLGALLRAGDLVCLEGELGTGKTTLVQGIASGWGSLDAVSSPTFVLVNVYRGSQGSRLYHLDAYRLSAAQEAVDLDMDIMLDHGPLVIEWADRLRSVLPPENLWIKIRWIDDEQRDLLFTVHGERYEDLMARIRQRLFGVA